MTIFVHYEFMNGGMKSFTFSLTFRNVELLGFSPMRLTRQQLGRLGEELTSEYLRDCGWTIIQERFRVQRGEIDLVCRDGEVLVFVEVRARTSNEFGDGLESIHPKKVWRMSRVAQAYLHQYNWKGEFRIDVVALMMSVAGQVLDIHHISDITL
jgi:putative endonuclease